MPLPPAGMAALCCSLVLMWAVTENLPERAGPKASLAIWNSTLQSAGKYRLWFCTFPSLLFRFDHRGWF